MARLVVATLSLWLGFAVIPAYAVVGAPRSAAPVREYREGALLVRFRPGVSLRASNSVHRRVDARVARRFTTVPGLEHVLLPPGTSVPAALAIYRRDSAVEYAEPDSIVSVDVLPDDSLFAAQWNLHNVGQEGGLADADIDAPEAWSITTGSAGIVVAVIDTGIDVDHPDLVANLYRNEIECTPNGLDDDLNGFVDDCHGADAVDDDGDPNDDNGHGTHVAGILGATTNNAAGIAGVVQTVKIVACKALNSLGEGSKSDAIRCLDYVAALKDAGVPIVASNNSWGGTFPSVALADAISAQRDRDILFVAAAGNLASDAAHYPAAIYEPNVISVAATDRSDGLGSFSSFGSAIVHVGAPGVAILSTVNDSGYQTFSGTSMASPHVAGLVALLKADSPSHDWRALRNLVLAGGDPVASLAGVTVTGRRINAAGSLACSGMIVDARVRPAKSFVSANVGHPVLLAVQHNDCDAPAGAVAVNIEPGGQTVALLDDGNSPDAEAGDAIYSAEWTPSGAGSFTLAYPSGDVVTVDVSSGAIVNPSGSFSDLFGSSMAVDGNRIVVGAPQAIVAGVPAGAAYLFDVTTGEHLQTFANPFPDTEDVFGEHVAVRGDLVLVGAALEDTGAENAGAAYLFDANTGALLHTLANPSPGADDEFGFAVALTPDHAFVGAYLDDTLGENAGMGYLFATDTGALVASLADAAPGEFEGFAQSVAAVGADLVISTIYDSVDFVRLGNVSRYDADPASATFGAAVVNYSPAGPFRADPPVLALSFGAALAASAEHVVVGDPYAIVDARALNVSASAFLGGAAHLYHAADGTYLTSFTDPERTVDDLFGWSVAVEGNAIFIGTPLSGARALAGGRAYAYDANTGQLRRVHHSPAPVGGDLFGVAVAATPSALLAAARGDDSAGVDAGAIFRFARPPLRTEQTCYIGSDASDPRFKAVEVPVADLFDSKRVRVAKPAGVCRSAASGLFWNPDPAAALSCYKAKDATHQAAFLEREVTIVNRFASQRIVVRKSKSVCLPSSIDAVGATTDLDAYRCYTVRQAKGDIGFQRTTVALDDPYANTRLEIRKPDSLCVAADVDSRGIDGPDDHLACYRAKPAKGYPAFAGANAQAQDVLGTHLIRLKKVRTYCVPTQITSSP